MAARKRSPRIWWLAKKTRRTTLRHELFSLRLFLRWCERKGIIAEAPKIDLPARDDRAADCLAPDEVKAVLAEIPETVEQGATVGRPLRAFFQVMYYQGLRDRTVCLLTWEDYNKKTGELHIRKEIDKSKYERTIKVFAETRSILDGMRPNIVPRGTFIFGPAKRWSPIKKAAKKAGFEHLDISEHTLRHSRTTELCSRPDADPAAVAFLLGWRDVATLYARYFHPTKRHADRFVDAVDGVSAAPANRK
jgi:site-specific recombinase XerD